MLENFDKSKDPFKVPENYFENFNKNIMEQLPAKEKKRVRIVPLWTKVLSWTAVAAILCGVFFSVGIFNKNNVVIDKVVSEQKQPTTLQGESLEDDYYLFLEDEVIKSQYKDMILSSNQN